MKSNYLVSIFAFFFSITLLAQNEDLSNLNQCRLKFLKSMEENDVKPPSKLEELNTVEYSSRDYSVEEASSLQILPIFTKKKKRYYHLFKYFEGRSKKQIVECADNDKLHEMEWFVGLDITAIIQFNSENCFLKHEHDISSLGGIMAELSRRRSHIKIDFLINSIGAAGGNLIAATSEIRRYLSESSNKKYDDLSPLIRRYQDQLSHPETSLNPELQIINN